RPIAASVQVTSRRRQSPAVARVSPCSSSSYSIRAMHPDLRRHSAAECDNGRDAESSPPLHVAAEGRHCAVSWSCSRMTLALADLRLWLVRGRSLFRRGLASLRTRGWRHSWERVKRQFARPAPPRHGPLIAADRSPFAPFDVPHADDSQASIVIPVYGQWSHTLACLRAIAAWPPARPVELILGDDASPAGTLVHAAHMEGLRVVSRPANGGFIAACNVGAAAARGRFLVFLNNDTVPQPGWLDALLE